MNSRHARARLGLLAVTVLWGATFSLNQVALRSIGAVTLTFLRFTLAALFLVAVFGRRREFWRDLRRGEILGGVATGALLFGAYLTQTEGQRYVSASLAGFLTGLSVVLVPLLVLALHRRPSRLQFGAAMLALIGLYLLAGPGGSGHLLGIILVLACAFFFAVELVVAEYLSVQVAVAGLTLVQMSTVALLAGIVALTPGGGGLLPLHASDEAWFTVIINGVGASALGFLAQTWSLRWLDSIEISILYSLEPVFAALVALVALHQRLSILGWVGGLVVVAAMLLVSTGSPRDNTSHSGPQESSP